MFAAWGNCQTERWFYSGQEGLRHMVTSGATNIPSGSIVVSRDAITIDLDWCNTTKDPGCLQRVRCRHPKNSRSFDSARVLRRDAHLLYLCRYGEILEKGCRHTLVKVVHPGSNKKRTHAHFSEHSR